MFSQRETNKQTKTVTVRSKKENRSFRRQEINSSVRLGWVSYSRREFYIDFFSANVLETFYIWLGMHACMQEGRQTHTHKYVHESFNKRQSNFSSTVPHGMLITSNIRNTPSKFHTCISEKNWFQSLFTLVRLFYGIEKEQVGAT